MANTTTEKKRVRLPLWIKEAIKPLPTWVKFSLGGYKTARAFIVKRQPSQELTRPETRGFIAGLVEGEAWIGYWRRCVPGKSSPKISPLIEIGMRDRKPVEFLGKVTNVPLVYEGITRVYRWRVYGLRALLVARMIRHSLKGVAKEKVEFLIERGFSVTNEEADEFLKRFRTRKVGLSTPHD